MLNGMSKSEHHDILVKVHVLAPKWLEHFGLYWKGIEIPYIYHKSIKEK